MLRAALQPGAPGRAAWTAWRGAVDDPVAALKAARPFVARWLPVLYDMLCRNEAEVDDTVAPYLRAAVLHEELRARTCRAICHDILVALAPLAPLVVGDAAIAESVYPRHDRRHVHSLEVLVRNEQLAEALRRLPAAGLGTPVPTGSGSVGSAHLTHPSGLPIVVRTELAQRPYWAIDAAAVRQRSRAAHVTGVPLPITAPADALLLVLAGAAFPAGGPSLHWVCDAWYLAAQHHEPDWGTFVDAAAASQLAVPAMVLLRFLVAELGAPVPDVVLEGLDRAAARSGRVAYELVWHALRTSGRATFRHMLRTAPGWQASASLLRWLWVPSGEFLRATGQLPPRWVLPLYYLYRPLRALWWRARGARVPWPRHMAGGAAAGQPPQ